MGGELTNVSEVEECSSCFSLYSWVMWSGHAQQRTNSTLSDNLNFISLYKRSTLYHSKVHTLFVWSYISQARSITLIRGLSKNAQTWPCKHTMSCTAYLQHHVDDYSFTTLLVKHHPSLVHTTMTYVHTEYVTSTVSLSTNRQLQGLWYTHRHCTAPRHCLCSAVQSVVSARPTQRLWSCS